MLISSIDSLTKENYFSERKFKTSHFDVKWLRTLLTFWCKNIQNFIISSKYTKLIIHFISHFTYTLFYKKGRHFLSSYFISEPMLKLFFKTFIFSIHRYIFFCVCHKCYDIDRIFKFLLELRDRKEVLLFLSKWFGIIS